MIAEQRLQEVANGLQRAVEEEFGCRFAVKQDSFVHQGIARAFDEAVNTVEKVRELASVLSFDVPKLGLPTGAQYLADFGTTIGRTIALPRSWYDRERAVTRILTMGHEGGHVGQHLDGVKAGWWPEDVGHSVLYLCSVLTEDAAEYVGKVEADQYATTEATRSWLGGPANRRTIEEIGESLHRHYALMAAGVDTAQAVLKSHYRAMDRGGQPNVRSARMAIDWLETHAADLKGAVIS